MSGSQFLDFTDSAARKVGALIAEEGNPALKLRIYVSGGGCAGFQYNFAFDETVNEDDFVVEKNGVSLLVDAMSGQYMEGASVDYEEGLEGSRFVVSNPNAQTSCGCGKSFGV